MHLPKGTRYTLSSGFWKSSSFKLADKSMHEFLNVNTHIPIYVIHRISFLKVKTYQSISLSVCQVKTSNLLLLTTDLKWKGILEGNILAQRLSKEATSMLLHSSPPRELMTLGVGPSTVAHKLRESDLLISRRKGD